MSEELVSVANAVARVGASFFVQSAALVAMALGAARLLGRTAALRSAICRATLAAVIALPLVAVLAWAAGLSVELMTFPRARLPQGWSLTEELSRPWSRTAAGDPSRRPERSEGPLEGLPSGEARDPSGGPEASSGASAAVAYACLAFSLLWAVGATLLLGHLAVCHISLARVRRRARALPDGELARELEALSSRLRVPVPALLASDEIRSPVLTGFLAPAILLPAADAGAPAETLRAVLLHELAHLARHDCLANLTARVACAVFFFQPLVWVLARRMEQASDEVADDAVLNAGVPAASYARDLADWAERYLPSRREAAAALGVVRFRSALARRLRRVLDAACRRISHLPRRVLLGVGLAAAALCLGASLLALHGGMSSVSASRAAGPRELVIAIGPADVLELDHPALLRLIARYEIEKSPPPWLGISRETMEDWRGEPFSPIEAGPGWGGAREDRPLSVWITGAHDLEELCKGLAGGAKRVDIMCDGPWLERLPLLTRRRDIGLVCETEALSDLALLARQTGITRLVIMNAARVSDLTPLSQHTRLKYLALDGCSKVRDLRPLSGLTSLRALCLSRCPRLSDLRPLEKLPCLEELSLLGCPNIADLTPLPKVPNLRLVGLVACPKANVAPFESLRYRGPVRLVKEAARLGD